MKAENGSRLTVDSSNINNTIKFSALSHTWFPSLWRNLSADVVTENADQIFTNVSFIVFNYDRCIEHFLFESLKTYYWMHPDCAANILRGLKIYHPYGRVGELASLNKSEGVAFGQKTVDLLTIASQIKIFTERTEEGTELKAMRAEIASAAKLVFLGFAYHEMNLKLLTSGQRTNVARIYGTSLGMSDSDSRILKAQMHAMLRETPTVSADDHVAFRNLQLDTNLRTELHRGKCSDLFREYSRSIAD